MHLTDTVLAPGRIFDQQFEFMPGRSTENAVAELRQAVSASEGKYTVALLFDNVW